MTDSNETLAYEYGRDVGYVDGYDTGIRDFAERLKSIYIGDSYNAHTLVGTLFDNIDNLVAEMIDNQ